MKPPVAFIDADILLHRAVAFTDDEFDGEPMNDWKQALSNFEGILNNWMEGVGKVSDYYLVVSLDSNFRKDLYPDYKANRRDIVPHPAFARLKEEVKTLQATIWEEGIEADDLIGLKVTSVPNSIAVSADKDFTTLPCKLFIPASHGKKKGEWFEFTEDEANMNWLRQAMTGDTIDNYKGIPGIGPKKAEKIIPRPAPLDVMWGNVRRAFIENNMTEADAILMARLARILRAGDYDFEKKEVKLWNPTRKAGTSE